MTRVHRPWSKEDVATATSMRAAGYSYAQIGAAIDRSRGQVFNRLNYTNKAIERPVHIPQTLENGGYSRTQLTKQNDEFAEAMRRAMTGGQT